MEQSLRNIPFGQWPSPLTPDLMGRRTRFEDVQWSMDGKSIIWLESRGGQGILVIKTEGEARRDLFSQYSARGGVGYGGGEFCAGRESVIFVEKGCQLFRICLPYGPVKPITPVYGSAASPVISPDQQRVVYVFSDGKNDALAMADAEGVEWPVKLTSGADFYMQPAWSPDNCSIAWVEWDHPHMPWQAARVVTGDLDAEYPRILKKNVIADGICTQPQFSPDGRWLAYIADDGEWEKLVLVDRKTGQQKSVVQGEKTLLRSPAWGQGLRTYVWAPDSSSIYYLKNYASQVTLWQVDVDDGTQKQIDCSPFTWLGQLTINPATRELALAASASQHPDRILRTNGSIWQAEAYNDAWLLDANTFSTGQIVDWRTDDGSKVHGIFYAPYLPGLSSTGKPPLIVNIHGGPTGGVDLRFPREAQFFTSRGYAWLDVIYRGSSGYGHAYQQALDGCWGELDTQDAVSGARAMAQRGLADETRMVIYGGSAGGFTVLNALIQYPGVFKAGIASYPVADLVSIALDTHKFETHYNEGLVGHLPEDIEVYRQRSPLHNAEKIKDRLMIFQGSEDKAVPPAQTLAIVNRLREKGIPVSYQVYEGEGHGFRKPENIADHFRQVERFLIENVLLN